MTLKSLTFDWTPFDAFPEMTVTCTNDHTYRSHAITVSGSQGVELVARKACPNCGAIALRRASSDPESFTLKR